LVIHVIAVNNPTRECSARCFGIMSPKILIPKHRAQAPDAKAIPVLPQARFQMTQGKAA
jgi:hypothetical protein